MDAAEIRRVLVVGAGTMGRQIALQCATHGFEVVLLDDGRGEVTALRTEAGVLHAPDMRVTISLTSDARATSESASAEGHRHDHGLRKVAAGA